LVAIPIFYNEVILPNPKNCRDVDYLAEYIATAGWRHTTSLSVVNLQSNEAVDAETDADPVPSEGIDDKNGHMRLGQTSSFGSLRRTFHPS
jgi:hypothetical protein